MPHGRPFLLPSAARRLARSGLEAAHDIGDPFHAHSSVTVLKLVVPKGSLEEQTLKLLERADLRVRRGSARDYHGTIEEYFAAKARLFTPELSYRAVVNNDSPEGRRLIGQVEIPTLTFGLEQEPLQLMRIGAASQADLATRVDDAMPRHATS